MLAGIAGVTLEKQYVNLFAKEHLGEEYLKVNPMHKVPFIVDGDFKMGESRSILRYLANMYMPADNTLYPKEPKARAKIDELLDYDLGTIFATGSKLLRPKIFGPVKELDPEAEKAFREVLGHLDSGLQGKTKFFLGDNLTIADVSMAATLSFPDACGYDISEFKALGAYLKRLKEAIPKYSEINDEAVERMRGFIKSKQEGN